MLHGDYSKLMSYAIQGFSPNTRIWTSKHFIASKQTHTVNLSMRLFQFVIIFPYLVSLVSHASHIRQLIICSAWSTRLLFHVGLWGCKCEVKLAFARRDIWQTHNSHKRRHKHTRPKRCRFRPSISNSRWNDCSSTQIRLTPEATPSQSNAPEWACIWAGAEIPDWLASLILIHVLVYCAWFRIFLIINLP